MRACACCVPFKKIFNFATPLHVDFQNSFAHQCWVGGGASLFVSLQVVPTTEKPNQSLPPALHQPFSHLFEHLVWQPVVVRLLDFQPGSCVEFPSVPAPIRWKMFLDFAFWILSMTNCELWLTLFLVFFLRFPVLLTADTFLVWPKSTFVIVFLLWERFVFIFYLSSSWVLLVVLFLI